MAKLARKPRVAMILIKMPHKVNSKCNRNGRTTEPHTGDIQQTERTNTYSLLSTRSRERWERWIRSDKNMTNTNTNPPYLYLHLYFRLKARRFAAASSVFLYHPVRAHRVSAARTKNTQIELGLPTTHSARVKCSE